MLQSLLGVEETRLYPTIDMGICNIAPRLDFLYYNISKVENICRKLQYKLFK